MPVHPIVAEMLKQMAEADGPAMTDMSPEEARTMYRVMQASSPRPELPVVKDAMAGHIPLRIYKASNAPDQPVVVFFHGGGWVIGDLETHDSGCRQLSLAADCTIIAVDYRLAPEHPYPAAIDDCYQATEWVASHAAELGIDATRIAVAGDSAGGNLAACVCIKSQLEHGPAICFQLLIYPVTNAAMNTESYERNGEGYMLGRDTMEWFWNHYANGDTLDGALASPLNHDQFEELPPACIITAEYDPLCDEGEAYGRKLESAGVPVTIRRFDGMIHGFFAMTNVLDGSKEAMALAAAELRNAFTIK